MAKQVKKTAVIARTRGAKAEVLDAAAKAKNPRAVVGNNSERGETISADDMILNAAANALKDKAFNNLVLSEEADGTAAEQMAMACRIARRTIHDDTTPSWTLAGKEYDKMMDLVKALIAHFGLKEPEMVDRNNRTPEERDAVRAYNAQRALVERGTKLNVALEKCNVQDDQFTEETGKWTLPAQSFSKDGYRYSNPEMMITLHRRAMYSMHTPVDANDKLPEIDRYFASVARLIEVHCPANTARRSTRGSQSQGSQTGKGAAQSNADKPTPVGEGIATDGDKREPWLAKSDSFSGYCDAITRRLTGIGRGNGWKLTKEELTDAEWAALAHAMRTYRRACQALQFNPETLKPVENTEQKNAA